jgi:hypothetical protein
MKQSGKTMIRVDSEPSGVSAIMSSIDAIIEKDHQRAEKCDSHKRLDYEQIKRDVQACKAAGLIKKAPRQSSRHDELAAKWYSLTSHTKPNTRLIGRKIGQEYHATVTILCGKTPADSDTIDRLHAIIDYAIAYGKDETDMMLRENQL